MNEIQSPSDPKKVILYPRSKLPRSLAVGQIINITSKTNVVRTYTVLQFMDSLVSLDSHTMRNDEILPTVAFA